MLTIALLVGCFAVFGASQSFAVVNPHIDTSDGISCLFCHVQGFENAAAGEYTLLEETIDAVCLRCHVKTECCIIGREHMDDLFIGASHPSDLDAGDMRRESRPKNLPLQDGKMTCNTCHFHRRPEGRDYKLVRLVEFVGAGVDWSRLCADCHADY